MPQRRPLVLIAGRLCALPDGDTLTGVSVSVGGLPVAEPVVVSGGATGLVYIAGADPLPEFLTTDDGDVITAVTE